MKILLFIYNLILIIITPIICIIFYFVMLIKKQHKHYWERFGFIKIDDIDPKKRTRKSVFFHCASVGEVKSIKKLVDVLRQEHPDYNIIVSTTTITGRKIAQYFIKADKVFLLPIENSRAISYILSYMNVALLIIIDTELWPNLIYTATNKIPVFLINARLSDKSFKMYKRFSFIFKNLLNKFTCIITKSKLDEERFVSILGNNNKIITGGNLKFQERKDEKDINLIDEFSSIKFFLAASTHKGEEEEIIAWFSTSENKLSFDKLIFAPRHIERAEEINKIIEKYGFSVGLYSEKDFSKDVIIIDTFGLLEALYIMADKIFIGGSLVNIGGHNIYEALQFKKTIATGKYMSSFQEIYNASKKFNLVWTIENKDDAINYLTAKDENQDFDSFFKEIDKKNSDTIALIIEVLKEVMVPSPTITKYQENK